MLEYNSFQIIKQFLMLLRPSCSSLFKCCLTILFAHFKSKGFDILLLNLSLYSQSYNLGCHVCKIKKKSV